MNLKDFWKISKTPELFLQHVPNNVEENINFRRELHICLFEDEKAKSHYLALCFLDPVIFFNTALWCPNPRGKSGKRNVPFILYPHQVPAARELKKAFDEGYDANIDKSRDEGATFLLCGLIILYFLLQEKFTVLLGSRIEPLVDSSAEIVNGEVVGNELSLFYKLLYLLNSVPLYLQPKIKKSHLFLQNLENGSSVSGQATSMGFGKGSRATIIAIDELAAIEPKIAQTIIENIMDVARCCIFNSTQGDWGEAHPYAKMILDPKVKTIILDWSENPKKNKGLYRSPKEGLIQIKDIEYWRQISPIFNNIKPMQTLEIDNIVDVYPFIADGGVSNFKSWRSVWFDGEQKRPGRTLRGLAQNILRIPSGASDLFFQFDLIQNLRDNVREPDYYGDISYELKPNKYIGEVWFEAGGRQSIFCWWGELPNGRPTQSHNYVVGCDISKGTGTSNSVAAIEDVNTNEIVGLLVTPYLSIPNFAEQVVALCEWCGGNIEPLLIWEENGAPEFLWRVEELGYYNFYTKVDAEGNKLKSKTKHGWRSTKGPTGTKVSILNALESALYEGLRKQPRFKPLRIYDSQTINELGSYVYFEGKVDIGLASMQTETSGAKAAHGDRGIAVALCNEGRKQIEPGICVTTQMIHPDSWLARKQNKETAIAKQKENSKIWWN